MIPYKRDCRKQGGLFFFEYGRVLSNAILDYCFRPESPDAGPLCDGRDSGQLRKHLFLLLITFIVNLIFDDHKPSDQLCQPSIPITSKQSSTPAFSHPAFQTSFPFPCLDKFEPRVHSGKTLCCWEHDH